MFKQGNITIRTQAPDDAVWGHVFFDRDLEDGVTQVQHGVIYPQQTRRDVLTVRAPAEGEPACASPEAWLRTAEALWEVPDNHAIYVVAHARSMRLPLAGNLDAIVHAKESRASLWTLPSPVPPEMKCFEQWRPERWSIRIDQELVGVLHVWEPVHPLKGLDEKGMAQLPTHPTNGAQSKRLCITNELWYVFEDVVLGGSDELRFIANDMDDDGLLDAGQILRGHAGRTHPNGTCIMVACSYYGTPQPWAAQSSRASRK